MSPKTMIRIRDIFMIVLFLLTYSVSYTQAQTDDASNISSPYGDVLPVNTWNTECASYHTGYGNCSVDLAAGEGTTLYSPITGIVTASYVDANGTPTVRIENKYWVVYLLHLLTTLVQGQSVVRGEVIGSESNMGNTGLFTTDENGESVFVHCGTGSKCGFHLHYEVKNKITGKWINPWKLMLGDPQNADGSLQAQQKKYFDGKIVTSSFGVSIEEVTPEATVPTIEPTLLTINPEPVQPPNHTNNNSQDHTGEILTWCILLGGLISLGVIAFSPTRHKRMGVIMLMITLVLGVFLTNQGVKLTLESPALVEMTDTPQSTASSETPLSQQGERQTEDIIVTNVVIRHLPSDSPTAQSAPLSNTVATGTCNINPRWPASIQQWCPWITTYSQQNDLDPDIIAAMMWQESRGNYAESSVCATGLIQVMPSDGALDENFHCTHDRSTENLNRYISYYQGVFNKRPTMAELADPEFNLDYGTRYYGGLKKKHGSDWEALLYYGGPAYGDTYRGAVMSHFDCVVNNKSGSCRSDLLAQLSS